MNERLNAGRICSHDLQTVTRQHDLVQAAQLMREHHVGALVVVEQNNSQRRAIGMLTDRDIVTAVIANGLQAAVLQVGDVMSRRLVTVREDASLVDLLRSMRNHGLRRLPVLDAQDHLLGMVTRDDVIEVLAQALELAASVVPASAARERQMRKGSSKAGKTAARSTHEATADP